jgi:hypothetical protein
MWTLIVLSTAIGFEEPKVTRYDEYLSKKECYQAWYKLSSEFTEGEEAYCKFTQPKKLIHDGEWKEPKKLDTIRTTHCHSGYHQESHNKKLH